MTITYEEALSTLQSMFSPQGYTQHQLDTILRHFGGHMENCVECILSHGDASPDSLIRKLSTLSSDGTAATSTNNSNALASNNATPDISADEELARQLAAQEQQNSRNNTTSNYARTTTNNAGAAAARRQQLQSQRRPMASTVTAPKSPPRTTATLPPAATKGRGIATTLPSDFLRIPGKSYPSSTTANTNTNTAVNSNGMTDEQLARMLQDELFQEELRNNPEFSHLARGGRQNIGGRQQQNQQQGPDILEKLGELGEAATKRFQAFAAGFQSQNRTNGGGGLFGGNNQNGVNSPRGNERRGLLDDLDMDEEEMDFLGSSGGRDVELQSVGSGRRDKKTD